MLGSLFDYEIKIEPPVFLSLVIVQSLNFRAFADGNSLVEKYDSFSIVESDWHVVDFCIYLELHNFRQFTNGEIIWNVKSEVELSDKALVVDYFGIDRLNYHCK